ncbi:MAG: ATPase, T2SS/T4P/T4SS family [Oscillospiraceae bacterium]
MQAYYDALSHLPRYYCDILSKLPPDIADEVTEIRIRLNRPIVLTLRHSFTFVTQSGEPCEYKPQGLLSTDAGAVESCFLSLCNYSVYALQSCIREGFIPISGGHRAGICGSAYIDAHGDMSVKDITSINLRVARGEIVFCDTRVAELLKKPNIGILIVGVPSSGKTTVLRGIIKALSDMGKRTAVVDERRELWDYRMQKMPVHTDVLSGYPKATGMLQAIRSLSPEVLVCDEVGGIDDAYAITAAVNSGVGIVMSAHAASEQGLYARPQSKVILETGAISAICFLKGRETPSFIERIVQC